MHMPALHLPRFDARIRQGKQGLEIFDVFRQKYLKITPEEWVRQHLLQHLVNGLGYPKARLSVEKSIEFNKMTRRYDAVIYNHNGQYPILLIECKAPHIGIDQTVFDQAARYNRVLGVDYFLLSNGMTHLFAFVDHEAGRYRFLEEIPDWASFTALLKAV